MSLTTTAWLMLGTLIIYFLVLFTISHFSSKEADNNAFFRADHRSPWMLVAFGMISASISGVTFISVPGWVNATQFTYLQMCAGFFVGYLLVAFVLLPLYYRLRLTSIYSYLGDRFGVCSRKTGAAFFLVSKTAGAAARLYLAIFVLHTFIGQAAGIPFGITAALSLFLIWLYTRKSGIKTIVRTDALQTLCMLLALAGIFWAVKDQLHLDWGGVLHTIDASPMHQVFAWEGKQSFWRQFFSGIFIVIVMTGLDQDMMQKNLTCRNLRAAQKDMCAYGACFLPVNLLFLMLGVMLYTFCAQHQIALPEKTDQLLPMLISKGYLGTLVVLPFSIGIIAAAFSSADSALTALTTSFCIDMLDMEKREWTAARQQQVRKWVHIAMTLLFLVCVLVFRALSSGNVLNAIYVMASYSYGPLLGLYTFGLFTHWSVRDKAVPFACLAGPIICGIFDHYSQDWWGYSFGYELLMLNGVITFILLWSLSKKQKSTFSL